MAQSYGDPNVTSILAFDEIVGTKREDQKLGTSVSAKNPADTTGVDSFDLNLDADGAQTVTLAVSNTPEEIAIDIQEKVRALTTAGVPQSVYDNFTAVYDSTEDQFVLTSGSTDTTPAISSAVVTTGAGTAAANLKLGTPGGGTEALTGSEITTWLITYRFEFHPNYWSITITVLGSEMIDPTDSAEAKTIADPRATQAKQEKALSITSTTATSELDGPVTL